MGALFCRTVLQVEQLMILEAIRQSMQEQTRQKQDGSSGIGVGDDQSTPRDGGAAGGEGRGGSHGSANQRALQFM